MNQMIYIIRGWLKDYRQMYPYKSNRNNKLLVMNIEISLINILIGRISGYHLYHHIILHILYGKYVNK